MTKSFSFLLIVLLLGHPTVHGAGALLTDPASGTAQLAAQRVLITFSDGRQQLFIQSAFTGSATNLGWVIPLPSPAVAEEVSADLFSSLNRLFQPQVIGAVRPWWLYLTAFGLVVALVRPLYRRSRLGAALVVLITLLSTLYLWRPVQSPTHTPPPALAQSNDSPHPLATPDAGVFEITVIEPATERALQDWVARNGLHLSTGALELFADHAERGWIFVAIQAHSLAGTNDQRVLPPVRLTFNSPQPFYPLRLAALNQRPVHIDLYVFGIGRAGASGFKPRRGSPVQAQPNPRKWHPAGARGSLDLLAPDLRNLVADAPFGTWLSRIVDPLQATQDVRIEWKDRERHGERLYTHAAALQFAANVAACCLAGCLLIIIGLRHRLPRTHSLHPTLSRLLFAVMGIAFLTFLMIPKTSDQGWTSHWEFIDGTSAQESSPFPGSAPSDSTLPTAN